MPVGKQGCCKWMNYPEERVEVAEMIKSNGVDNLVAVAGDAGFTLAADTSRGNRPGFSSAAPPEEGKRLYEHFAAALAAEGVAVETGAFGADMQVSLTNDGPVTISIES